MQELLSLTKSGILAFETVTEDDIKEGCHHLARKGFFVEPTSAVVWGALKKAENTLQGGVVAILSGHGLKA